jgi:hypothetical protein
MRSQADADACIVGLGVFDLAGEWKDNGGFTWAHVPKERELSFDTRDSPLGAVAMTS